MHEHYDAIARMREEKKSHHCIMAIGLNSVYLTEMENYFSQSN